MAPLIDFNSKKVKKRMGFINGFGAAIVVIGALFKILHLPGGDVVIGGGLIVEALLFMIGAFEPVPVHYHWENVHPDLIVDEDDHSSIEENHVKKESNLKKVSKVMNNAGIDIDSELVERLDRSISHFTEVLNTISSNTSQFDVLTTKTGEYVDKVSKVTSSMDSLNNAYVSQINQMDNQIKYSGEFVSSMSKSIDSTNGIREELEGLKLNLKSLNSVYGGMLSAMNR